MLLVIVSSVLLAMLWFSTELASITLAVNGLPVKNKYRNVVTIYGGEYFI